MRMYRRVKCGDKVWAPRCGGYWTTRGYANSRIANSRIGHLMDWSTRGLDKSQSGQLADATGNLSA